MASTRSARAKRASSATPAVQAGCAANWLGFATAAWQLSLEATLVVPLRLARMAGGGDAAAREAKLMVSEKVEAHSRVISAIGSGRYGGSAGEIANAAMQHYLDCVRANRRRLMRGE